ncbi:ATP-binding protein [Mesorhizobium sp. BR1-1-12]|uniref:ATP-binding protein n=1 Tax=unclassified Mesorhizobium TaxID=325217 RepID=UPI0015E3EAFA|nr:MULTISPECIES: ATP-binding protein [unclassified Mesorhizobium]MBZ9918261.1 ATP-binding protein [Mesorhizobium sp. BR1-1-7]MBZ9970642.1 ATP-binding protein [Mesorhizobium sp. BR1-1-12]MBZ9970859.1 ATP-binding protein [Mesorhizobium sp. BR1-1-12]
MARIRVRARAVDMLGRQQIAGIPTAVHELFKNAHDAYADSVRVDYFHADELFLLRDDGVGMTLVDFESRWLTLGTESKVGANDPGQIVWTGPRGAGVRAITGEKGIGRLAIAAIGPQVLLLTRSVRPEGLGSLVVSLIQWGLFEVPGLDLDAIEVPVVELEGGQLPDLSVVTSLADRIRGNIGQLGEQIPSAIRQRLLSELDMADFDPAAIYAQIEGPSLAEGNFGTHFFIRPTNPVLADDIEQAEDGGSEATPLEKMLLGFGNTMIPEASSPPISAQFWDHREDGTSRDLIGGSAFFTPEEFDAADHHIDGEFDEFGQFIGDVSVYGQPAKAHTIVWPDSTGRPTECGAFRLRFAYVQGSLKDSRVPPDEWARLSVKLNKIGGLYVYRDNIRILPYGNSDYDFLGIERRRTKSAQDWFFSYRRLFGAVELTHARNGKLVEKAGREGFRANRAYREFVSMLENVFERLAIDFFRPTSQFGEEYNSLRAELNQEAKLLAKRAKRTKERQGEFKTELETFFTAIESGAPTQEAERIRAMTEERLSAVAAIKSPEAAADALLNAEAEARRAIAALERSITVIKPRAVGLGKGLTSDWTAYQQNSDRIRREVVMPLLVEMEERVSEVAATNDIDVDRRRRLLASLEQRRSSTENETARLRRQVLERVTGLSQQVESMARKALERMASGFELIFAEVGRTNISDMTESDLAHLQRGWEARSDTIAKDTRELLEALGEQLVSLAGTVAEGGTLDETTAALESRADALEEQLDLYSELAQSGMAIGIVQHEFANTVKRIRTAIAQLQPWAYGTSEIRVIRDDLSAGFDHLDSYLALFTPLSRRLNRKPIELSGEEIRNYLFEIFGDRLKRHGIKLIATPAFRTKIMVALPPIILPSFVNVVDNAIHWITTVPGGEREILLDADEDSFLISNSGPGIPLRLADRIFEFGATEKPGGRGMGLFIARQALRSNGMDLTLRKSGENVRPQFAIGHTEQSGGDNG